jgi:hypothetical protein
MATQKSSDVVVAMYKDALFFASKSSHPVALISISDYYTRSQVNGSNGQSIPLCAKLT